MCGDGGEAIIIEMGLNIPLKASNKFIQMIQHNVGQEKNKKKKKKNFDLKMVRIRK